MTYFFGALITAFYLPWYPRSGVEFRWVVILVGISALMWAERRELPWTLAVKLFAAFYVLATCSLAWSDYPLLSIGRWFELTALAVVFYLGGVLERVDELLTGLIIGLVPSVLLLPFQLAGWSPVEQWSVPAGVFVSKLQLVEVAVPLLFVSVARGWWWSALICASAAILPSVRGAWLALVVTSLIAMTRRPRCDWRCLTGATCLLLLFAVALGVLLNPITVQHRLLIWSETIAALTPLGHGLGSHLPVYGAAHAHNDFLEIAYELGVPGVMLFVVAISSLTRFGGEWHGIVSLVILSLTSFPLQNPASSVVFALLAGGLAVDRWRAWYDDRDERDRVREELFADVRRSPAGYPVRGRS